MTERPNLKERGLRATVALYCVRPDLINGATLEQIGDRSGRLRQAVHKLAASFRLTTSSSHEICRRPSRLLPSAERLAQMEAVYQEMQVMYFGSARPWSEIVQRLTQLESVINQLDSQPS